MKLWVALRHEQCDLFVLGYCCKYSMKFIKEKVNKKFQLLLFYSEKKSLIVLLSCWNNKLKKLNYHFIINIIIATVEP